MTARSVRRLKPLIYPILFFFCWTNLGIYNIAHAAAKGSGQGAVADGQQKAQSPEEKFQESLERLRDAAGKEDREKIKAERIKIEKHDVEIKKQFKDTEDRIKGLPEAIKQRHREFVKKYEENLNALKTHLDRIDKAKNKAEEKVEVEKAKAFLEKTKAPTRHVPLDPNKLPHRTPEIKKREPRLKKEEFEKQNTEDRSQKTVVGWALPTKTKTSPIMVAANGPLNGLVSSLPRLQGEGWGEGGVDSPTILALNTLDLPTPADLTQTIEVQFTPDIQAKAAELGHQPVKIYEWVRNNIEYVPTYGSIQGADMCLQTKQCNDFDTASLLIALLRASNISARYVYGTVELPVDKVMNWVGGFTDPVSAVNFIASGGVPVTAVRFGGVIEKVRMEHVWVKAWIDYIPSRGAIHKEGDTWIPLDASFKQHTYTQGIDLQTAVPFDGQTFTGQVKAASTINEAEGYVTNVSSTVVQGALDNYNTRLQDYVNTNYPNATVGDILGKKEITKKDQQILPASLPFKVMVTGSENSEIPDQYRQKVTIQLADVYATAFTYTTSLPQIAGKRITVSYDPATQADQDTINRYAQDYATSIPAYLVNLKPVLKVENTVVATGPMIGMGNPQDLNISLPSPTGTENVTHKLNAGGYTAIGINPSKTSLQALQKRIDKNDFSEPVGEMLHQTALSYWAEADAFNDVTAKSLNVTTIRHPSELAATAKITVTYLYGMPVSATYKSRNLDVKFDNQAVMSKGGDKTKEFSYMQQSGATSSFLEGAVFDQLFGRNIGDGISAITALKLANDQGIPIYRINATNLSTVLPKLQVSEEIKNEIVNAINAGLTVQIPKNNITQLGWTGVGYIISNPTDGSGAYRISGGLNGGESALIGAAVYPIAQIPASGVSSMLIGSLSSSAGVSLKVVGDVIIGIELTPVMIASATAILAIAIIIIIATTISRNKAPENWKILRHYTDHNGLLEILFPTQGVQYIKASDETAEYGPGAYLSDYVLEPDNGGLNSFLIARTLGITRPDNIQPSKVTAYIVLKIDWNIHGSSFGIHGFQYVYIPGNLIIDGKTVQIETYYPFP